jgi:hypothetical protein
MCGAAEREMQILHIDYESGFSNIHKDVTLADGKNRPRRAIKGDIATQNPPFMSDFGRYWSSGRHKSYYFCISIGQNA